MSDESDALQTGRCDEGVDIYPESAEPRPPPSGDGADPLRTSVDFPSFPWSKQTEEQTTNTDLPTVSSSSDLYNVHHKQRGHVLVINQERFDFRLRNLGYGDRAGSDVDGKNIKKTFAQLGFQVSFHSNVSASYMRRLCKKMAARDHSDSDCFACVILSHGEAGIVFGTDDAVEIKELTDYFRGDSCQTLVGKPKLFFIQACRGTVTDPGVEVDVTDAIVEKTSDVIKLPMYADFLFAYSTVPGYYSWRNSRDGSWFIQSLCKNLEKYGHVLEIQKLLLRVNKDLANKYQSYNPDSASFHQKKQISCAASMLTKDLYFPKNK